MPRRIQVVLETDGNATKYMANPPDVSELESNKNIKITWFKNGHGHFRWLVLYSNVFTNLKTQVCVNYGTFFKKTWLSLISSYF